MTAPSSVVGMLYIVDVHLVNRSTQEQVKHKILIVGGEQSDIERKLRWVFDASTYSGFVIKSVDKVRDKVHFLSSVIQQPAPATPPVVERDGRSELVAQAKPTSERYDPNLYAVGITTTMLAKDEQHAIRKVANALMASATEGASHSGARLGDDSTVVVERIAKSSGYAMPRDMSNDSNTAHILRG